jgi:acetyltransferase-like isoleucine patch superfamily enzyme
MWILVRGPQAVHFSGTDTMMKKLSMILKFPADVWQMFVTGLPGPVGVALRRAFWKRRLKFLGERVLIGTGVIFQNPGHITLDDHCWIDRNVTIFAGPPTPGRITYMKENPQFTLNAGDVHIGKGVHIAPNCVLSGMGGLYIGQMSGVAANSAIYSFSHHYRNLCDRKDDYQYIYSPFARPDQQSMIMGPVFIGDYCAVGLNSVVLPGTSLKRGSWVASGSVVSGSYGEQSLLMTEQQIVVKSLGNFTLKTDLPG